MIIFKFLETELVYFWNEYASNIISLTQGQEGVNSTDYLPFLLKLGTANFSGIREVSTDHIDC